MNIMGTLQWAVNSSIDVDSLVSIFFNFYEKNSDKPKSVDNNVRDDYIPSPSLRNKTLQISWSSLFVSLIKPVSLLSSI